MNTFPLGNWRHLWMVYMQPILLHQILLGYVINPRSIKKSEMARSEVQAYLKRVSFANWAFGALTVFPNFCIYQGTVIQWIAMALGVDYGVAFCLFIGVYFGLFGVTQGAALKGVDKGLAKSLFFGFSLSLALGVALCFVLGSIEGVAIGEVEVVAFVVVFCVVYPSFYFRLPLYPIEVAIQLWVNVTSRFAYSPVLFHDLCFLPLPGLHTTILNAYSKDPALAQRLLDACSRSPGCRKIGRIAQQSLMTRTS